GAGLRDVADAGRCPTYGAAGRETVGGAGVAHAVTGFRHVTEAGRCPADGRALGVVRACGARPAAGLLDVADAGGRPTRGAAGGEGVGGAGVADAVAALGHVAQAGRGPADGGALRVRGTGRARPGALLRDIADAGGRATGRTARDEAVRRAAVADPVAALGQVADTSRGPADGRALGVVRARGARPRARLLDVADAGRGPAHGGALGVVRARGARTRACLLDVADAGRGTADRARGLDRARGGAAVPAREVAVVARLGGLEDAVAADRSLERDDGRGPVASRVDRSVGEVAAGGGDDAVLGVDGHVPVGVAGDAGSDVG